jgi:plastin-1
MVENLNCVINSCKAIGCPVVNIGAQDLMTGKEHLILGLIWQIVRAGLSQKVDIRYKLFSLCDSFPKIPS